MNILEIIDKKRLGKKLQRQEIAYFIKGYTAGTIPDYQAAALIMAICIQGMDDEEIVNLTLEMAYSGEVLDLSDIGDTIIDKHSTGGVGDKITLVLMPIVASLGIPVVKMSGRGLGITGGTIDKLESIPGYCTNCTIEEMKQNVKRVGISLVSQSMDLAPADKKIYALRDTISCTESIPLIASSIMSKKIAAGSNKIILEVTAGSGAFMKNREQAQKLADMMQRIGTLAGKETVCEITDMEQPLGYAVGNNLEIIETIECLKGNMPKDIQEVVMILGAQILRMAGRGEDLQENVKLIWNNVENGKAYNKFKELVENQGGDISYIENPEKFGKAKYSYCLLAEKDGCVKTMDAGIIGKVVMELGAGRKKKEDGIDPEVGVILHKKVGDKIEKGEKIVTILANQEEKGKLALQEMKKACEVY